MLIVGTEASEYDKSGGRRKKHLPLVAIVIFSLNWMVFAVTIQQRQPTAKVDLKKGLKDIKVVQDFGPVSGYCLVPQEIRTGKDVTAPYFIHKEFEAYDQRFVAVKIHVTYELKQYPGPSPIYLTLLTHMFMHGDWLHIIGNMIVFMVVAPKVEERMGHFLFTVFYLVCGLGAALLQVIMADGDGLYIPCLGASGAIFGVLGAYGFLRPFDQIRVLVPPFILKAPAIVFVFVYGLFQYIFGLLAMEEGSLGGVAYWAHLGGLLSGLAFLAFCIVVLKSAQPPPPLPVVLTNPDVPAAGPVGLPGHLGGHVSQGPPMIKMGAEAPTWVSSWYPR
jgi:membrane associated rhomboid family serine protease